MNVTLTPEQEKFVAEEISRGHYQSAEEVIRQGLEFLRSHEEFIAQNLEALRKEIAIGIEAADRGELIDGELAFKKLRERIRRRAGQPQ